MTDFLQPVGKKWRRLAAFGVALSTLISGVIFIFVLVFVAIAGVKKEDIGPVLGTLAIFWFLAIVSCLTLVRLGRGSFSANGITVMPAWMISIFGVLLAAGAVGPAVVVGLVLLFVESLGFVGAMVFVSRLIRQRRQAAGPPASAIVGLMSPMEIDRTSSARFPETIDATGPYDNEVRYILRTEDVKAFQRYHAGNWLSGSRLFPMLLVICTIVSVSSLALFLIGWICGKQLGPLPHAIAVAASVLLGLLIGLRGNAHLLPGKRSSPQLSENQLLSISPEKLVLKTSAFSTETRWASIENIAVTPDHAFFYVMSSTAYVLPKRAFIDRAAFLEFVARARGYRAAAQS